MLVSERSTLEATPEFAALVDNLAKGCRVLAWAEGVHMKSEYLKIRNAVIQHLVERELICAIAVESNFWLSRPADAYSRGIHTGPLTDRTVQGVWSWTRKALAANLELLQWLRRHNAGRADGEKVRLYGLEMYGDKENMDGELDRSLSDEPAELEHAQYLHSHLQQHRAFGGDHRDTAERDAAQYATLKWVAERHPRGTVFVFEQVEHLDARLPGSLASHLVNGSLGSFRAVGALWRENETSVTYPLGPCLELSRWFEQAREKETTDLIKTPLGGLLMDLRPYRHEKVGLPSDQVKENCGPVTLVQAAAAFDAFLYTPSLSPAATVSLDTQYTGWC